ncbi:MAG: DUF1801 domain-containing protein [Phycisphaerales bacterium]
MQSKAKTVAAYLAELDPERRAALTVVRNVILKNMDKGPDGKSGYEEGMQYGMIGYFVPHSIFPAGYHCDPKLPLGFAGLASQKNYMSVYLMGIYVEGDAGPPSAYAQWFHAAWARSGKKKDIGKCCIRFKRVEDLPLDVIGEAIARMPVAEYVAGYVRSREEAAGGKGAGGKKTKGQIAKGKGQMGKKKVAAKAKGTKRA